MQETELILYVEELEKGRSCEEEFPRILIFIKIYNPLTKSIHILLKIYCGAGNRVDPVCRRIGEGAELWGGVSAHPHFHQNLRPPDQEHPQCRQGLPTQVKLLNKLRVPVLSVPDPEFRTVGTRIWLQEKLYKKQSTHFQS
jgi:hypothetical protein